MPTVVFSSVSGQSVEWHMIYRGTKTAAVSIWALLRSVWLQVEASVRLETDELFVHI